MVEPILLTKNMPCVVIIAEESSRGSRQIDRNHLAVTVSDSRQHVAMQQWFRGSPPSFWRRRGGSEERFSSPLPVSVALRCRSCCRFDAHERRCNITITIAIAIVMWWAAVCLLSHVHPHFTYFTLRRRESTVADACLLGGLGLVLAEGLSQEKRPNSGHHLVTPPSNFALIGTEKSVKTAAL